MNTLTTLTEILNKLKDEGYTTDFNLESNCIVCHGNSLAIHPDDFAIDRYFRFEGSSDPDDQAIVYAISSTKHNLKGVLVNGYGIYTDDKNDKIMAEIDKKVKHLHASQ